MGPRQLQSQIHADYTTELASWEAYRTGVTGLYAQAVRKDDYNSHLIREYNRKIHVLNQPTGLFIAPFDAGYSFIGSSMTAPVGIESIEGYAFPQETLSAPDGSSYAWSIDGSTVSTSQTFTPTIYHIGKTISCLVDGTTYSTTVWHPNQISAVKAFWWANTGVFKSGNIVAQDGDPVYGWYDIINNYYAIGGANNVNNMPKYEATDLASPSIRNDFTDFYTMNSEAEDVLNSVKNAYCFIGAKDNFPSSGSNHTMFAVIGSGNEIIFNLGSKISGSAAFYLQSKKTDGTAVLVTGSSANSNYNVIGAEVLFNSSVSKLRVNGQVLNSGVLNGSATTSNSNAYSMYINYNLPNNSSFDSYVTAVILAGGDTPLTSTEINRLERFVGLLGNIDVPLI